MRYEYYKTCPKCEGTGKLEAVTPPKPPIGLKPRKIHTEERANEIWEAIRRYKEAKKDIPVEWLDELQDIFEYLRGK